MAAGRTSSSGRPPGRKSAVSGLPLLPGPPVVAIIAEMSASVLIVDDDPAFQGLASRLLAECGLAVAGRVDSARAAIEAAGRLRPDAVLLDIGLPDGDGIALARELAALPWRPRVLLTSSNADAAGPSEVRRSLAEAFIPKSQLPNAALDRLLGARAP